MAGRNNVFDKRISFINTRKVSMDEIMGNENEEEKEDVEEKQDEPLKKVSTPPTRRKRSYKKKSTGVSAKKREVKPVDEAVAESAVVAPPSASMSLAGDRISIQSLWPARLIVRDTPSGEEYVWANAGAIEAVNLADVEFLMSKNRGDVPSDKKGCCGGDGTRIYFALV